MRSDLAAIFSGCFDAGVMSPPSKPNAGCVRPTQPGMWIAEIRPVRRCCSRGVVSAAAGCATTPSDSCLSATGGLETFFVTNAEGGGGVVAEVPELGTYALILAGLGAVGLVNRRRRV